MFQFSPKILEIFWNQKCLGSKRKFSIRIRISNPTWTHSCAHLPHEEFILAIYLILSCSAFWRYFHQRNLNQGPQTECREIVVPFNGKAHWQQGETTLNEFNDGKRWSSYRPWWQGLVIHACTTLCWIIPFSESINVLPHVSGEICLHNL